MITDYVVLFDAGRPHGESSHAANFTGRVGADKRFLYRLLWGLIAATLIAGSITAILAAALATGPLQPG